MMRPPDIDLSPFGLKTAVSVADDVGSNLFTDFEESAMLRRAIDTGILCPSVCHVPVL